MQPEPRPADSIVGGMNTLRSLLVLGFVAAFVLVYGNFIWDIWQARVDETAPPQFNDGLVNLSRSPWASGRTRSSEPPQHSQRS
jgi:hypothetical protein